MTKVIVQELQEIVDGTTEEMSLQAFPKTAGDGTDVTFCSRVLHSSSQKSFIACG